MHADFFWIRTMFSRSSPRSFSDDCSSFVPIQEGFSPLDSFNNFLCVTTTTGWLRGELQPWRTIIVGSMLEKDKHCIKDFVQFDLLFMRFYVLYIRCLFLDACQCRFFQKKSNSVYAGTELGVPARAMAPLCCNFFSSETAPKIHVDWSLNFVNIAPVAPSNQYYVLLAPSKHFSWLHP
jgi:hypothetical protein